MRRSYEEGLAAFGWAGERFAASTGYAKMMYEGMRDHYGRLFGRLSLLCA
jgi:hypothetical protein